MDTLIRDKISRAAEFIRFQVKQGIERDRAIAMMRDRSTLGPKAWDMVLELVDESKFIVKL